MNIYIPIEIKVRELEGRGLLAIVAAERGHTVVIGEKKDTISLAAKGKLPPGIVHMKSITPHESMIELLRQLKEQGHMVTAQDEEGGLVDHSYDTFAKLRFSAETAALTEKVMAWGDHDAKSLKEMYPEQAEKFVPAGSPRADFWRRDFSPYFQVPELRDGYQGKPYLLIVSNFSGMLNENRFWNILARLRQAGYFDRKDGRERHEFENAAYQLNLIGEFVFMIRDLSESYPELNILVRPHPVESVEGWKKLIGDGYTNVFVERKDTISKWIRNSVAIIHNGCTSALEAASAGIYRIAYRPIPHRIEREIPNEMSINAFTMEELHRAIQAILQDKSPEGYEEAEARADKMLRSRFPNLDGKLGADRIVDEWEAIEERLNPGQAGAEELLSVEKKERIKPAKRFKRALVQIRNSIIGAPDQKNKDKKLLKSGHKFPDFKEEELSEVLESLQATLPRFRDVRYKRFGEKSFILYSDKQY